MNLLDFSTVVLRKPYQLGCNNGDGMDCLLLIKEYLEGVKEVQFPKSFGGMSLLSYKDDYMYDKDKAFNIFGELLLTLCSKVRPIDRNAGDILFFNTSSDNSLASGIDIGNGSMLTVAIGIGVTVSSLKYFLIKDCYRCQQQYQ